MFVFRFWFIYQNGRWDGVFLHIIFMMFEHVCSWCTVEDCLWTSWFHWQPYHFGYGNFLFNLWTILLFPRFRSIVFIIFFVSDRPSKFHVYKINGQEYLDGKRCCRLCFIWQICIGNSLLAFYPCIFGSTTFHDDSPSIQSCIFSKIKNHCSLEWN